MAHGAGCSVPADGGDDDLGAAAEALTGASSVAAGMRAHPHPFAIGMSNEIGGFNDFRSASHTPASEPRFCHVYTYWDIAQHDVPGGGSTHHLDGLFAFMKKAEGSCDEVLVTFQGSQKKDAVSKPPSAAEFETAFRAFLDWTKPGKPLEKWAERLSFTAWNEPNNPTGEGNALNHEITPELAAAYYLRARKHCDPKEHCRVAAADFATNWKWDPDIWRNCADDEDAKNSAAHCAKNSIYNPEGHAPSYLDRYKHFIARNAKAETDGVLPDGFRPEFWAYHPWHDVNSYLDGKKACSNYENCTTRRLLESLSGSWADSNIWDTEIGLGMQDKKEPGRDGQQPCAAAFLVRLTQLSPRFTRLYYMKFELADGGKGPLLDGQTLRPAGHVLANRETHYSGAKCANTGIELDAYENPVIPMFERPEGVSAPKGAAPTEGCPDPMGLKTKSGEYYIYCTSYTEPYTRLDGFPIFKADSLAGNHWKRVGSIIPDVGASRASWPSWIKDKHGHREGNFWAPDVHELPNGKFVALYAAPYGGAQAVGMAWADGPSGPWKHKMDAPFINHGNNGPPKGANANTYDGNLLVVSAHELYVYWVVAGSGIWGREVTYQPTGELEFKKGSHAVHLQDHGEGPYMFAHGGAYYLFYSTDPAGGLVYDYQVRARRASSPLVSFTPACTMDSQCDVGTCTSGVCDGSVTVLHKSNDANGGAVHDRSFVATGGNSIIKDAEDGVDFFVYHGIVVPEDHACPRKDPTNGKNVPESAAHNPYCRVQGDRQAMIDPLTWTPDGKGGFWPLVNGGTPTNGWRILPENESPPRLDWAPPADVCTTLPHADTGDACVASLCQALPECCTGAWDQHCVDQVPAYCVASYLCAGQCKDAAGCSGGQGCLATYTCGACVEDYDCAPKACNTGTGQCQ